jgi:hypothetical protein
MGGFSPAERVLRSLANWNCRMVWRDAESAETDGETHRELESEMENLAEHH